MRTTSSSISASQEGQRSLQRQSHSCHQSVAQGQVWCFRNHGMSVKQRRATHDRRVHAFINYCGASEALTEAGSRPPGFGQVDRSDRSGEHRAIAAAADPRTQPLIAATGAIIHHGGGWPSTGPRPTPLLPAREGHRLVRQNADIPLMFSVRLDDQRCNNRLILRTKHQPLNQRVHGSSPCAPTIKINDLGVELNIKSEPETSSGQRSGQHSADFVAGSAGALHFPVTGIVSPYDALGFESLARRLESCGLPGEILPARHGDIDISRASARSHGTRGRQDWPEYCLFILPWFHPRTRAA